MSDVQQGPGWWMASDGLWYPPEDQPAGDEPPQPGWWMASDGEWYPPEDQPEATVDQATGWWMASDGEWYPPDEEPGDDAHPPGWWIADDGTWYPPEAHPDARVRAEAATAATYGGAGRPPPMAQSGQTPFYMPQTQYIQPAEFSKFDPNRQAEAVHVAGGLPTFGQVPASEGGLGLGAPQPPNMVDPSQLLPIPEEAVAVDTYRGPNSKNPAIRRRILIIIGLVVLGLLLLAAIGYALHATVLGHSSLAAPVSSVPPAVPFAGASPPPA